MGSFIVDQMAWAYFLCAFFYSAGIYSILRLGTNITALNSTIDAAQIKTDILDTTLSIFR